MANHISFLFVFVLLFIFFTCSLSRIIPNQENDQQGYATLDVSKSLENAQQVLSLSTFEQQDTKTALSNSNTNISLSFPLIPRHQLYKPQHSNYASLVLDRLARDSARVSSLNIKLQHLLHKYKNGHLQSLGLSTPVISGSSVGSGEYFARIGLGTPQKQFSMVLDTGSDINWIQCQPCTECYQQSDPIFNPATSTSYKKLTCQEPQCGALDMSTCQDGHCSYQVSYGDGSYTVGDLVTETVSFGNEKVENVAVGCGHDNEGLFVGSAGLLGLGGGKLSLPAQIQAKSFSYCLVDRDTTKTSTLEFNSVNLVRSVVAPMLKNAKVSTFYYIGLSGISVGGEPVVIPSSVFQSDVSGEGGVILDSGTAISRLQTQAYTSLRDSFVSKTRHLKSSNGVALFDTCYDLSSSNTVSLPTVSFHFGTYKLNLPSNNILVPVDGSGTFCFAFAPTRSSMSIIGNVQQQGIRVSFDLANSQVGFTPDNC